MQILACLAERRARVRLHRAVGADHRVAWADSWQEIEMLLRTMAIGALVVDPRLAGGVAVEGVRRVRERYPSVPVIVYTSFDSDLAPALLAWGDAGVSGVAFLDISDAEWDLRRLVEMAAGRSAAEQLLRKLEAELPNLSDDARHVLRVGLFEAATLQTVSEWADRAGLGRRKLYRLFRSVSLPTPKTCLQWLRLLYAAAALSDPGASVRDVVFRMRYSAPPNFWAHVRKVLNVTPSEMRWWVTVDDLVERFVSYCRERADDTATRRAAR